MVTDALAETQDLGPGPGEDLARNLADDTSLLASPPDVYLRINDMLKDDNASSDQFAKVVT